MRHAVTIEFTDELIASAGLTTEEIRQDAKLLLAAKLYELGRLSSGQATPLWLLSRWSMLGRFRTPSN